MLESFMELSDITKPAITIARTNTFREAVEKMIAEQTNSLLVIDEAGLLVGEVSVSNVLDAVVPDYLDTDTIAAQFTTESMFTEAITNASETLVADFMDTNFPKILITDNLMQAAQMAMKSKRARIPVVDHEDRPTGIISRRGIKHLIADALGIKDTA